MDGRKARCGRPTGRRILKSQTTEQYLKGNRYSKVSEFGWDTYRAVPVANVRDVLRYFHTLPYPLF